MKFVVFAEYLQELEKLSSRLAMTEKLAGLFLELEEEDIKPASYLMQGSLVPPYQSLEFQLSSKMVIRALARLDHEQQADDSTNLFGETDLTSAQAKVTAMFKKQGDLGLVAHDVMAETGNSAKHPSLIEVYGQLVEIAQFSGSGSQEQKVAALTKLLGQLEPVSAKFVARIVIGKLRLGFSTMTMLDALSWAVTGGKDHHDLLEQAYQKRADAGELAQYYLSHKSEIKSRENAEKLLSEYTVEVGVPVVPALCQRLNSAAEIIEKMGEVMAEPKYDGLRVQIHFIRQGKSGQPEISAYTRNLEDISHMFPELNSIGEALDCDRCILDSEAIGVDPETGKLMNFQQTITRKRKHDIAEAALSVPIRFYIFDVLKIDDKPLIDKKLRERKDLLKALLKENESFMYTPTLVTSDPDELQAFHHQLLADGLEGAVIKTIDGDYQSGRKGWRWVKIKEAEGTSGKLSDTLDLVVMGYYAGRGKRSALGIGAFLVGTVVADDEIQTVAKIGTGLTDEQFMDMKKRADALAVAEKPKQYQVPKSLAPDVWITPKQVVEIAADEVTKSPIHTAGYALRFPRLVKFRDDKTWEQVTTLEEIKSLV